MLPFLDKFLRNFPAVQTRQVLKEMSQARQRGEIINEKDLKEQLMHLANITDEEELKIQAPFLFFYEGDVLESDALKTFMQKIQLDTEASLGEVEHLGDAIRAHQKILVDHYFSGIDAAISELEKKVKGYELLALNRYRGFNNQRVYDFDGSMSVAGIDIKGSGSQTSEPQIIYGGEQRILRTQNETKIGANPDVNPTQDSNPTTSVIQQSSVLSDLASFSQSEQNIDPFVDIRSNKTLTWAPPVQGEAGLKLAIEEETFHKFRDIELVLDSETSGVNIRGDRRNNTDGNDIDNVIDGKPDTEWGYSVKSIELVDSCSIKLFLSFAGTKRINAISIDPVSQLAMKLSAISYLSSGQTEVSVSFTEQLLKPSTKTIVQIGDVTAKGVYLTFTQSTAENTDVIVERDNTGNWKRPENNTEIFDWLYNNQQLNEIFPNADDTQINIKYHDYNFGFKDVIAIERTFKEDGLFVPEIFKTKSTVNSLSIYADIDYPASVFSDVEFLIRKENYIKDSENKEVFQDVETFPIIPVGTSTLNERLFLTQQVDGTAFDTGRLRFYPDFSQNLSIYSNNALLTIGVDYEVSIDKGNTWETSFTFTGVADKTPTCLVKLSTPRTDKIFTVVYSPLISTQEPGGEVFINENKSIILERNETYVFENNRAGQNNNITSSRILLQTIVRSNTLNNRVTPYLKDVVLLMGIKNG